MIRDHSCEMCGRGGMNDPLDVVTRERDELRQALDELALQRGKGKDYSSRLMNHMARAYGASSAADSMREERDSARARVRELEAVLRAIIETTGLPVLAAHNRMRDMSRAALAKAKEPSK